MVLHCVFTWCFHVQFLRVVFSKVLRGGGVTGKLAGVVGRLAAGWAGWLLVGLAGWLASFLYCVFNDLRIAFTLCF